MFDIEPHYGWLHMYDPEKDKHSPFYGVEHNIFEFDRSVYNMPAHPLWEDIDSENLLLKILFADYAEGYAIIELMGEWNDLQFNDFKLMCRNCLELLFDYGINKFILICENVFHVYLESDEYYAAFQEDIGDGWIFLLRGRAEVLAEFEHYGISAYVAWSLQLDALNWRKMKPEDLYAAVQAYYQRLLP